MERGRFWLVTVLALALLAAAAIFWSAYHPGRSSIVPAGGKIKIVTTFLPLYVFTVNVAGPTATVENLLPAGVGPHQYAFRPADVRRLAEADLIVTNGLGLETWAEGVIKESGTKAKTIDAGLGVPTKGEPPDPHIWLDPTRAEMMVKNIADALSRFDSAKTVLYQSNAATYIKKLRKLDQDYLGALEPPAVKRTDFIAFHSAFSYLAEHYGLVQKAVIEEFPGKEPGAKYLAEVIDLIKREKVRAIFSEPQFSPKVIQTVAEETGLKVRELDTMEVGELSPDTYEKAMRKNLQTLIEALSE